MRLLHAIVVFVAASLAVAQGVTTYNAPHGKTPSSCVTSKPGVLFELSNEHLALGSKRGVSKEVERNTGTLRFQLANGVLTDTRGWTGYIADNYQFQFDDPPQAGALYTGGFSICKNGSLALGSSATFWSCLSGNTEGGYFGNMYDRYWAPQCKPIALVTHPVSTAANLPLPSPLKATPTQSAMTSSVISNDSVDNVTDPTSSQIGSGRSNNFKTNSTSTGSGPVNASVNLVTSTSTPTSGVHNTASRASATTSRKVTPISDAAPAAIWGVQALVLAAGLVGIAFA